MSSGPTHEEILRSLVHDLRQPLGNLETSLFYLNLVLSPASPRVQEQLQAMERQVAQAAGLLIRATEELHAVRARSAASDSLPFTKSATAGVT